MTFRDHKSDGYCFIFVMISNPFQVVPCSFVLIQMMNEHIYSALFLHLRDRGVLLRIRRSLIDIIKHSCNTLHLQLIGGNSQFLRVAFTQGRLKMRLL